MISTLLTTLLIIDALVLIILIIALQQGNEGGLGGALEEVTQPAFWCNWWCQTYRKSNMDLWDSFYISNLLSWKKTHDKYELKINWRKPFPRQR